MFGALFFHQRAMPLHEGARMGERLMVGEKPGMRHRVAVEEHPRQVIAGVSLEAQVVCQELLTHFPRFAVVGAAERQRSTHFNGIVRMPVILEPSV